MREIKFRVWDKLSKTMRYGAENNLVIVLNNPDFEVMQFTGLLDKQGKEIYEGDIVNFHTDYEIENDDYSGITQVMWIEKEAGFYPLTLNNRWRCDVIVEIIGNIYENPELIKKDKNE